VNEPKGNDTDRKEFRMQTTGAAVVKGIEVEELVERLDGFYSYNLAVMHFSQALGDRLEGQASFLLSDELEEVAEEALQAAKKLADRIGELGGVVTADPALLVERSPLSEFSLPESYSEVGVILGHVLERVRMIVGEYGTFLVQARGRDELSHRLVLKLLAEQVARASKIEAALAQSRGGCGPPKHVHEEATECEQGVIRR
jgi:ferritin-like protein